MATEKSHDRATCNNKSRGNIEAPRAHYIVITSSDPPRKGSRYQEKRTDPMALEGNDLVRHVG